MKIAHFLIKIPQAMRLAALCLTMTIYGIAPDVIAGEVSGLYEAEVAVKGQGDAERNRALKEALAEVLIKVSGNRNVISMAALQQVLSRPMELAQQFRYRELPKVENQQDSPFPQAAMGTQEPVKQVLWVSFDAQAVNQALNNAGLPVWGRARPSTLVWLAVEDDNERYLLGGDSHPDVQEQIRHEAQRRAVPVLIPLLDLEDQANLRFTDVWGNFQEVIVEASGRYQAEALWVGRVYRQFDNLWQARWSLYLEDDKQYWEITADQPIDVIASGIDGLADALSAKFSKIISEMDFNTVKVLVTDVHTLEDYARIKKYLHSLDPVTQLQVEEVSTPTVMFMLGIRSDRAELEQAIGFGSTLAPVLPSDVNDSMNSDRAGPQALVAAQTLYYRLLR